MPNVTNQLYRWSIVYFGTLDEQPTVAKCFDTIAKNYIYQLEKCPTTGSHHFQCFVRLRTKKRKNELCKILNAMSLSGASVSPSSNDSALAQYSMKNLSRIAGPWSDKPIYLGEDLISTLRPWQQTIYDLIGTQPEKRIVHWYYDEHGGSGKTSLSKYLYFHHGIVTLTIGKGSDLLNLVYKMQGLPMYIFDISRTVPRNSMSELYMAIEAVKNGYFVNTKYDTGVACFAIPHIIVFSNYMYKRSALSSDRWLLHDLSQMSQGNEYSGTDTARCPPNI